MSALLSKKISIIYLLLIVIVTSASTYLFARKMAIRSFSERTEKEATTTTQCDFRIKRLGGSSLINPILFVENDCESEKLQMLKQDIINALATFTNDGTITKSSVYLRKFLSSEWISINGSETYSPGSMLKVPELITYLKMSEKTPGLLDKKILCDKVFPNEKKAVIVSKTITKGQYYTIRELLEYMIQYSDNNATYLLTRHMDADIFRQVFEDVGLPVPDRQSKAYPITAADYSKFMRTLFNGTYLTAEHSEFAIKLLSKSDFKSGIAKSIPEDVRVAHKFGEEGNMNHQELHESAIVYLDNTPYVLTVMTKGNNLTRQTKVLSTISSMVFQSLSAQKTL